MVKKHMAAALTRADLDGLEERLITQFGRRIDSLEGRVADHGKDIRRLMLESVATNERVTAIRDDVRRDLRDFRMEFTGTLDAFASKMETLWRETMVFPKLLDDHGALLRSHEARLQTLEARRPAP